MTSECACEVVKQQTTSFTPTQTSSSSPTITPGPNAKLLVWYDFEDDFETTGEVRDKSGNNLHAKKQGPVASEKGAVGNKAISLSGSGYLQADKNPLAGRKDLTISFWFKTKYPGDNFKMASAAIWSGGQGSGWTMATHVPEFWAENGEGVLIPAQKNNENNFAPDIWNFEAVTYDGSQVKEYTNGNLINNWTSQGTAFGSGAPMAIGTWGGSFSFIGEIDDFRIYERALNRDEINSLYALKNP